MAVKDKKYQLGTAENKAFLDAARDNLLNFGTKFPAPDGSSYWLGDDGTPWKDRNRATWITCRMTHVYCLGAFVGFPGAEELVDAGLKGLKGALHDDVNDGWYPEITPEGGYTPTKQCYAHAFVLLASSSATLLGRPGAAELLDHAEKVFLDKFWDDETGLSVDTWNTEFTELDPYRGLNANMHSVEAFLAVADVTGDETWRKRAGRIIEHVLGWAKANNWRIPEHFHSDWSLDLECNREKPDDQFKPYGRDSGPRHRMGPPDHPVGHQHLSVRSGGRGPVHRRRGASVQPCGRGCVERGRCARPRIHHRLGRQARRARPYALDAGRGHQHVLHARPRDRQGIVRQVVCDVPRVRGQHGDGSRQRILVPPARPHQPADRHRVAGQVRPVPRDAVHDDSAARPESVHRTGGQEAGLSLHQPA